MTIQATEESRIDRISLSLNNLMVWFIDGCAGESNNIWVKYMGDGRYRIHNVFCFAPIHCCCECLDGFFWWLPEEMLSLRKIKYRRIIVTPFFCYVDYIMAVVECKIPLPTAKVMSGGKFYEIFVFYIQKFSSYSTLYSAILETRTAQRSMMRQVVSCSVLAFIHPSFIWPRDACEDFQRIPAENFERACTIH